MGAWSGPFAIAVVLLAAGGVAKAIDPAMTAGALRRAGAPVPALVVRAAGAAEALLAVVALVSGEPVLAALVGLSYVLFTAFVAYALVRRIPIGSCGCFGRADTPPSAVHLGVNVLAAAASFVVAARDGGGIGAVLATQPLAGIPFVALVVVGAYAAFVAMTRLPQVSRLARGWRA